MSTRIIRSIFQVLGLSNRGRFEEKANAEMQRLIEALQEHPEDKAKGSLTLTIDFVKLGDRIDMKPSVKAKLPEEKGFPARIRYRTSGGGVSWFYQLYRWEYWLRTRVQNDLLKAGKDTALPTFEGAPEA